MPKLMKSLIPDNNLRTQHPTGEVIRRSSQSLAVSSSGSFKNRTLTSLNDPDNNHAVKIVVSGPSIRSLNGLNDNMSNETGQMDYSKFRIVNGIRYPVSTALVPDKPVQIIDHKHVIMSLALSKSGAIMATGDTANQISLWDFRDGSFILAFGCEAPCSSSLDLKCGMRPFRRRSSFSGTPSLHDRHNLGSFRRPSSEPLNNVPEANSVKGSSIIVGSRNSNEANSNDSAIQSNRSIPLPIGIINPKSQSQTASKLTLVERFQALHRGHSLSESSTQQKQPITSMKSKYNFISLFSHMSRSPISPRVIRPGVYCLTFSPDDLYLACAAAVPSLDQHLIFLWKLTTKKLKGTVNTHTMRINSVQFINVSSTRRLISCSSDGTICITDQAKLKETSTLSTGSAVMDFCIQSGVLLVTAQFSGEIQGWDINRESKLWVIDEPFRRHPILSVINGPEFELGTVITYSKDAIIRVFDVTHGKMKYEMSHPSMNSVSNFNKMALSMDNSTLAVGIKEGSLALWDYPNRQILAVVKQHKGSVTGLKWNLGGNLVSTEDRKLIIWDGNELAARYLNLC